MSPRSGPGLRVYLQLLAGMAVFGSATPVSKLVTDAFPVMVGGFARTALAALLLAPVGLVRLDEFRKLDARQHLRLALVALIGVFGFTAFMLYGMRWASGVAGSIVMSTTPAVTALASFLFFKDRFGWKKAAGVACAVAGVTVLHVTGTSGGGEGGGRPWLGSALVFGAVCAEACYTLLGKAVMETLSPVVLSFWSGLYAAVIFLPFALWQWSDVTWGALTGGDWAALVWWGAGTMALGSYLWYTGVQKVPGSVASGFMGVMPVSALVLSYVLLGEAFHWIHVVGFAVVLAGIGLVAWSYHEEMEEDDG